MQAMATVQHLMNAGKPQILEQSSYLIKYY